MTVHLAPTSKFGTSRLPKDGFRTLRSSLLSYFLSSWCARRRLVCLRAGSIFWFHPQSLCPPSLWYLRSHSISTFWLICAFLRLPCRSRLLKLRSDSSVPTPFLCGILITGTTPYWGGSWVPISAEMWDYILYSMNAPFGRTRVPSPTNLKMCDRTKPNVRFHPRVTQVRPNGAFIE